MDPYDAYLADSPEYRGSYGLADDVMRESHRERIRLLDRTPAQIREIRHH